jgi:uncharacterized membrane protein
MLPLIGVLVMVAGFLTRVNPVLVVVAAGAASGLAAGFDVLQLLTMFGEGFLRNRLLLLWVFTLPIIGLLEREGLRERARAWIVGLRAATPGRLLLAYQALRQGSAAIGLVSLGGHPQTVRPLVAPMAEALAGRLAPGLSEAARQRIRALAAATDNIALFFGEDLFLAFGAVLLMQGFLKDHGITIEPLHIALWGLPTAVSALAIHGWRLRRLDRGLRQQAPERR